MAAGKFRRVYRGHYEHFLLSLRLCLFISLPPLSSLTQSASPQTLQFLFTVVKSLTYFLLSPPWQQVNISECTEVIMNTFFSLYVFVSLSLFPLSSLSQSVSPQPLQFLVPIVKSLTYFLLRPPFSVQSPPVFNGTFEGVEKIL